MLLSIRSRLWLSYVAVIVVALAMVACVLTVFLVRNPYTYRQAAVRITAAQGLVSQQPSTAESTGMIANALGVRILEVAPSGDVKSDTAPDQAPLRGLFAERRIKQVLTTRDSNGRAWLFSQEQLPNEDRRIIATPRPGLLPVLSVVRDDIWRPMMGAALVALVLALVLAYVITRWIADPMQALIEAARSTAPGGLSYASFNQGVSADGASGRPAEKGPREVRELARAFNAMLRRVTASQRAQKEFVANVSHELRTPLTAIQGFSQAILDGTAATDDSRRQAAETIQREATRMHRLATDLLDLARLDAGSTEMLLEPVDIRDLLGRLKERFQPIAEAARVVLETDAPPNLPTVFGDGDRLARALGNLLENAIKFSPPGGVVRARADQRPGEICVVVSDSGPGITSADHERIFERFYQADASRRGGKNHGAGLGLAIAKEVVESHGGKIHVRSALGEGAEFSVHLPRMDGSRKQRDAA